MTSQRRTYIVRNGKVRVGHTYASQAAAYRLVGRLREEYRIGLSPISAVTVWVREPEETLFGLYERLDFTAEGES